MAEEEPPFKLKLFYNANAPLANGLRPKDILQLSDDEFERNHGFIQWAFPTNEQSRHSVDAPVLDLESAIWVSQQDKAVQFLEKATVRFLEFLASNSHWKADYNHNHLRISRAIHSLRLLHSWELADWFYSKVKEFSGDGVAKMAKARDHWDFQASPVHDRAAGSFVGLAIGDALGAPVEFAARGSFEPVTHYRQGGRFNLPAGAWTDDTAMALCLGQSLVKQQNFNASDLLGRFCDWAENGTNTSTGVAVGIGQNTLRVLGDFKRHGRLLALPFGTKNDGNGSLMRLSPVACFASQDLQYPIELAASQSKATHASRIAEECCKFLAALLVRLINGESYQSAKAKVLTGTWPLALKEAIGTDLQKVSETEIQSSGFVLITLQAALWAVESTNTFEDAVLKAANLGDDADTVAAVTGQIAGALYGYSRIGKLLKSRLAKERQLYVTSQFLSANWKRRETWDELRLR